MTTTPTASPELLDLETLRKIGILITTQDNRITDQPMFIVQQRRRMYGLDTGYCENFIWLCSEDEYNEASAEEADALEAEYQDTGRAKDGWQRTGYIDQWEFVTACLTEQGCIDYLKLDGHNLKEPRIYAEGSYRNEEFRAVRNSLIALARRAQPASEATQTACTVPPEGWYCTRAPGHDGPCAAWPVAQQDAAPSNSPEIPDGSTSAPGTPEAPAEPFMYAISTPNGKAYFDEHCVDTNAEALEAEVSLMNQLHGSGYRVVPVYTRAAQLDGGQEGSD